MNIIFTGGGTLGSVTPLLAVYEELVRITSVDALWIGTRRGPERLVVEHAGISFAAIFSGKIRRYVDVRNVVDPLLMVIGFFQSLYTILWFRPDIMVNAGSFVGVPVMFAGWLLRKRIVILQLDLEPMRSNRIIAPCAQTICVAVPELARYFPVKKTIVTGIPVRVHARQLPTDLNKSAAPRRPLIVVTGGGLGARAINDLVAHSLERLTRMADVVHVTGRDKEGESALHARANPHYHPFADRSLDEMHALLESADVVVTRAGMGTLAELSALGKPAVIIPIPHSPQEKNAVYITRHDAGVVLAQDSLTPEAFADTLADLLHNTAWRDRLSKNIARIFPCDAAVRLAQLFCETKK